MADISSQASHARFLCPGRGRQVCAEPSPSTSPSCCWGPVWSERVWLCQVPGLTVLGSRLAGYGVQMEGLWQPQGDPQTRWGLTQVPRDPGLTYAGPVYHWMPPPGSPVLCVSLQCGLNALIFPTGRWARLLALSLSPICSTDEDTLFLVASVPPGSPRHCAFVHGPPRAQPLPSTGSCAVVTARVRRVWPLPAMGRTQAGRHSKKASVA